MHKAVGKRTSGPPSAACPHPALPEATQEPRAETRQQLELESRSSSVSQLIPICELQHLTVPPACFVWAHP